MGVTLWVKTNGEIDHQNIIEQYIFPKGVMAVSIPVLPWCMHMWSILCCHPLLPLCAYVRTYPSIPTSLLIRVVSSTPVHLSCVSTLSGWKRSGLFSSLGRMHLQREVNESGIKQWRFRKLLFHKCTCMLMNVVLLHLDFVLIPIPSLILHSLLTENTQEGPHTYVPDEMRCSDQHFWHQLSQRILCMDIIIPWLHIYMYM